MVVAGGEPELDDRRLALPGRRGDAVSMRGGGKVTEERGYRSGDGRTEGQRSKIRPDGYEW